MDFVQMRGGEGPAQIFCPLFTNCIYWDNLGMGREGETPGQIFWHIGIKKKWYKLSKLEGEGGGVIWTKSRRTATFFQDTFPYSEAMRVGFIWDILADSHHKGKKEHWNPESHTRENSFYQIIL